MTSIKYIGMDVHTESTSVAVRNSLGKIVMEGVIETKANTKIFFLTFLFIGLGGYVAHQDVC